MKKISFLLLSLVVAAAAGEGLVRLLIQSRSSLVAGLSFQKAMDIRLHEIWDSPYHDPLSPPFATFADVDLNNQERLKEIYPFSTLPANLHQKAEDFLLAPGAGSYEVQTDSSGFRGTGNPTTGLPFRVLCLGSYFTFGEGVGNSEIWTTRLQASLSEALHRPVWVQNAGLNSATAIMGIAKLTLDDNLQKTDVIVIEYSNLDVITNDVLAKHDGRHQGQQHFVISDYVSRSRRWNDLFLSGPARHSYILFSIYNALMPFYVGDDHMDDQGIENYHQAIIQLVQVAKSKAKQVFLVAGPLALEGKTALLQSWSNEVSVPLLKVKEILRKNSAEFNSQPDWLSEYEEALPFYQDQYLYHDILGAYTNPYQVGAKAHEIFAEELKKSILTKFRHP